MLRVLLLVCGLLACSCAGQPPAQPRDFSRERVPASSRCCRLQADSADPRALVQCSREALAQASRSRSRAESTGARLPAYNITLVSYMTPDIFSYGAYSLALNSIFSEYHKYSMHVVTPGPGDDSRSRNSSSSSSRDERWAKVRVVLNLLQKRAHETEKPEESDREGEGGAGGEYVVWLDSDVVFLDMGLLLEEVAAQHAQHDLIISADSQAEMGVANTGLFLVKNTAWARGFLQQWLDMQFVQATSAPSSAGADYSRMSTNKMTMMDQLGFDRLYRSQLPAITRHVAILSPDALNSRFPAWLHQTSRNQVLHLAATSALLRRRVFQQGFAAVCRHLHEAAGDDENGDDGSPTDASPTSLLLTPQLGLTRSALLEMRRDLPVEDTIVECISSLERRLHLLDVTEEEGYVGAVAGGNDADEIFKVLVVMEDALRHRKALILPPDVHQSLMHVMARCHKYISALPSETSVTSSSISGRRLSHLHMLLVISFRYALMLFPDAQQTAPTEEVLQWAEGVLNEVLELARGRMARKNETEDGAAREFFYEMMFYKYKHLFVMAELSARANDNDEWRALQLYESAMQVWWERHAQRPARQHPRLAEHEHVDPSSEAFETMYRLAVLSCSLAPRPPRVGEQCYGRQLALQGLANVSRSLSFHDEVWKGVELAHLPDQVLVMTGKTMAVGGDCHKQLQQFAQAEEWYIKARQILRRLTLPSFKEHTSSLLSYLDSAIDFAAGERAAKMDPDDDAEWVMHSHRTGNLDAGQKTASRKPTVFRRRRVKATAPDI